MEENKMMDGGQSAPSKTNSTVVGVIIVILVLIAGWGIYLWSQSQSSPNSNMNNENTNTNVATEQPEIKIFNLTAKPFEFSMKEIRVKKGDTVRINLMVTEGFHDWVIDEFNAKTRQLPAGESDSVEFIADKTGTFEYYCSVDGHRGLGMVGNLIVE